MATTKYYVYGPDGAGVKDGSSPENAWDSIHDFIAINPTADQECMCRGSETLVAIPTLASSGTGLTDANRPRMYGCGADWVRGSAQYTINANGQNFGIHLNTKAFWEIEGFNISGMALDGISSPGSSQIIRKCKIISPPRMGINGASNPTFCVFDKIIVSNPTNIGISDGSSGSQNLALNCYIYGGSNYGIKFYNGDRIIGCIIRDCADDLIYFDYGALAVFNVLHGSTGGSGIRTTQDRLYIIIGNSITNNNQYGIEASHERNNENYNGFRSNGVANLLNTLPGLNSYTFAADPYVDSANSNFTRKDSSQTAENSIAVAVDWDEATPKNYAYVPAGLIPGDAAGSGGGGLLLNSSMLS